MLAEDVGAAADPEQMLRLRSQELNGRSRGPVNEMRVLLMPYDFSSRRILSLLVILLGGFWMLAAAQAADEPGTADPPVVGRYAGSSIVYQKNADFDEVALLKGPHDYGALLDRNDLKNRSSAEWLKLEGRVSRTRYEIPPGRSSLEVQRNYQNALKGNGFQVLFDCSDQACFAGNLKDPYLLGQQIDIENNVSTSYFDHARYTLMKGAQNGGDVYVAILSGEDKERTTAFVQVVEVKAMESGKVQVMSSTEMDKTLSESGKVAVYGLLFDTDQATLKPESKETLDEIAKLLTAKPQLRLEIVGHTDNRGTADYNQGLSSRRAQSVVTALTGDYAIAADRLTASGAGLTMPVASNDTEEGRAQNRRVELVAK